MELPSKLLEQIAFNTRPKLEEPVLFIMDKSTHEEYLSQPLQTNNKQFKIAVTFLTGYIGIFKVTDKNIKFFFTKSIDDKEPRQVSILPGAYELENLDKEVKRVINLESHYTNETYHFKIKPNFSTLGSIIEISPYVPGSYLDFCSDDSLRDLLGFKSKRLNDESNLSDYPVDSLSFDNIFLDCDIAERKIFKGKRSGIIHNWTMTVNPGFKYVEKCSGGISWYTME